MAITFLLCIACQVENMYSATALAWHPDGSSLSVGTTTGALDVYETCKQRLAYGSKFEIAYGLDGATRITPTSTGDPTSDLYDRHTGLVGLQARVSLHGKRLFVFAFERQHAFGFHNARSSTATIMACQSWHTTP